MSNSAIWWCTFAVVLAVNVVFTHQAVTPPKSPSGRSPNEHNRNQQLLRHKLGSTPGPPPPQEEEDLESFCTLNNFQNCISEFWPGSGSPGSTSTSSSSPVDSVHQRKAASNSFGTKEQQDSSETTTASGAPLGSDLAFPTTYRELQATCSDLKERVRCLDRHSERCFTPQMMQVFGHIVTNAKQFVHDLCDNKRVQSGK